MVVVYVYTDYSNKKRLEVLTARLSACGYEVKHVNNISNLDITNITNNIIISTNEENQYPIFKNFVKSNIYFMLNDKMKFYDYIKQNSDLLVDGITFIPTYDHTYKGPNIHKEFLVKDKNGYSAAFNKKVTGNVYDLIKTYALKHQIQDVMNVKHILGVSLSCMFGKILGVYSYKTNEAITNETLLNGFDATRGNFVEDPVVRKFIKRFIERINYFGIIEIEFLIDQNNTIHVMECNPRISGSLNVAPYFDWVIMPYIKTLQKRSIDEYDMDDTRLWTRT